MGLEKIPAGMRSDEPDGTFLRFFLEAGGMRMCYFGGPTGKQSGGDNLRIFFESRWSP